MTKSPLAARWTSSIKIPKTNKDAKIEARAVEWKGNILIVEEISHGASGPRDIKLSVFDTEALELVEIPSEIPQFDDERMQEIAIYNDKLYMWCGRHRGGKLFKYDFNNQKWTHLLLIDNHPFADNIVIVGNIMYVSSADYRHTQQRVIMINLDTNERVITEGDRYFHWNPLERLGLMVHDGELYTTYFVIHNRRIEKFFDEQWRLVAVDDASPKGSLNVNPAYPSGFRTVRSLSNGRMLLESCAPSRDTFLDTLNFESLKWERTQIETGWYDTPVAIIQSVIEINQVIYLLIKGSPWSDQYEIRMFDMRSQQKLSNLCLRNLVDTIVGTWDIEDIQKIRQRLCIPSRKRFDNMTSWRIADFVALQPNGKDLNDEYERMRNGEVVKREIAQKAREDISDSELSELSTASEIESD